MTTTDNLTVATENQTAAIALLADSLTPGTAGEAIAAALAQLDAQGMDLGTIHGCRFVYEGTDGVDLRVGTVGTDRRPWTAPRVRVAITDPEGSLTVYVMHNGAASSEIAFSNASWTVLAATLAAILEG